MKLSIIVPVYNVKDYLERCINSLIDESDEYEIILVDDGSTDGSSLLCDEFSKRYSKIRVIHKENGGLSDARNFGLKEAKGEKIIFVDSDDFLVPSAIKTILEIIEINDFDIIACNFTSYKGDTVTPLCYSNYSEITTGEKFLEYQYLKRSMLTSVVQNIYNRKLLVDNNFFFRKGIYHEDEEWTPRVWMAASRIKFIEYSFYCYMLREGSIMNQKKFDKHISDFQSTVVSLLELFSNKKGTPIYSLIKDDLINKYLSLYAKGKIAGKNKDLEFSYKYMKDDLFFFKTKMKLKIYRFNKSLFCKISDMLNAKR